MKKGKPSPVPTGPKQTARIEAVEGRKGVIGGRFVGHWRDWGKESKVYRDKDEAIRGALQAGFVKVMVDGKVVARKGGE